MAKDTQRQLAQTLYIDECLTAKEIAVKVDVTEKTVSSWVTAGKWKDLRLAKQTGPENLIKNLNELLNMMLEKRIALERKKVKTKDEEAEYTRIIDEMSKLSKMIDTNQKEGKTSLRIHIFCIEKFMSALHQHNTKLFTELLNFQPEYLNKLADELK
ncbi:MAG TPA: hypothetical protein VN698_09760 [Bacteroidia bacterium]|nr:hypothetical protein [Bacteroidia bacterium]